MKKLLSLFFIFLFAVCFLKAQTVEPALSKQTEENSLEQTVQEQQNPTDQETAEANQEEYLSAEESKSKETKTEKDKAENTEPEKPAPQEIEISNYPKELALAQDFTLSIALPTPAELEKDSYSQANFEILSAQPDESGLNIEIKAVPFVLGVSTFTALTFNGKNGESYITKPVNMEVKPVNTGIKEEKMLDIRSPYRPFNYWNILWLIIILALIAGGVFAYNKKKNLVKSHIINEFQTDGRPLDVIALDKLDYLVAGNLWQQGQYKFFYITMIDILRDYLSARFNIDAHKYTSRDLIRTLKKMPEFKADIRQLSDLNRSADYVKFAKVEPTEAQKEEDIRNMRNIIVDTRPPRLEAEQKTKEPKL